MPQANTHTHTDSCTYGIWLILPKLFVIRLHISPALVRSSNKALPLPPSLPSPLALSLSLCLGQFWVWATLFSILCSLFSVLCCALCVSIVWQLALFPLNWNCALASTLITIFVRPMLNFKLKTLIRIILVVVAVVWLRLHCQCAAKVRHLNELWAHLWPPPLETLPDLGLYTESWRKTLPQELDACSTYLSASVRVWQQWGQGGGREGAQWDTRLVASAVLIS